MNNKHILKEATRGSMKMETTNDKSVPDVKFLVRSEDRLSPCWIVHVEGFMLVI
jgi:hypothetical protein